MKRPPLQPGREGWKRVLAGGGLWLALGLVLAPKSSPAQLFQLVSNLQSLVNLYPATCSSPSCPLATRPNQTGHGDGPKAIAAADFDGDGYADLAISGTDGKVTVYFGLGNGRCGQEVCLCTDSPNLRGIICADLNGDGLPDIATACPQSGQVYVFFSQGDRSFVRTNWTAWRGVRNLATGDFDGDGRLDLVVAGPDNGLRQYRGLPGGGFAVVTNLTALSWPHADTHEYRPVYSLKAFRPAGATQDELVATHASTNRVWVLGANASGALEVRGSITTGGGRNDEVYSLDVGPILQPAASQMSDLVLAKLDAGTLEIHAGTEGPSRFSQAIQQARDAPGGPRAVLLEDLDGDGWNDLVVVARNFDEVLTYQNSNGVFSITTERPIGNSPRELVSADFNGDGLPDVAVINRVSADMSLLTSCPSQVGFTAVDHMYLVDGDVVGLAVYDFNHDGYDDVIQLHRSSGDFSVRLADTNGTGTLGPPVFYTIGQLPGAQVVADVNHDGVPDQVTVNLGERGIERASVAVRLGLGGGAFGPEQHFYLSNATEQVEGRLFALAAADFDNDGNIDLVAGFLDNRIAFFQGHGDGTFTFQRAHELVQQPRALVAADFDNDGDLDLAVVGLSGELVVVQNQMMENHTNLLYCTSLTTNHYPPPNTTNFYACALKAVDVNNDGFLDLVLGSGEGAYLYLGGPGLSFQLRPERLPGTDFPVSSLVTADFNRDGQEEVVVAGRVLDVISFLVPTNGSYAAAFTMDVPSSKYLATGDLDGDGWPDLVGSGRILWTALNHQAAQTTPPLTNQAQRQILAQPVINELLTINNSCPLEQDGGRTPAWVELFNGTNRAVSLSGWRLEAASTNDSGQTVTRTFTFTNTAWLQPAGHPGAYLLVVCSTNIRTSYHTGFELPSGGGTLTLLNSSGEVVDRVAYPPQQEDVSYARYRDGLRSFVFNPYPSPGRANPDNGHVQPVVSFDGVNVDQLAPGQPLRFYASVWDDVGVDSVSMLVQRLDLPNSPVQRVVLYDDGQHQDGAPDDNHFAGALDGAFVAAGAEFQFYLEVVDLSDQIVNVPQDPVFGRPGEPGNVMSLAVGVLGPPLEISEVVALNRTCFYETNGTNVGTPDYVEIRNYSASPVALTNLALAKQIGDNSVFYFPTGQVLQPGEHCLVLCDGDVEEGPWHAPFGLKSGGDQVLLLSFTPNGSPFVVDWVSFGALPADVAWARLCARGPWQQAAPTPGTENVARLWGGVALDNTGCAVFKLVFPTAAGATHIVEHTPSLNPATWTAVTNITGDGIERVVTWPLIGRGFFRMRQLCAPTEARLP